MVKSVIQLIFLALAYTRAGDQSSSLPSHHLNDSVLITAELVEGGGHRWSRTLEPNLCLHRDLNSQLTAQHANQALILNSTCLTQNIDFIE